MTLRLSTGTRNALAGNGGFATVFNRGVLQIYSGTQPATADSAATGTLLGTVTLGSAALTAETAATGSITITGGASGTINSITVGGFNIIPDGPVPFNTSVNQTASDLADAINRNDYYSAVWTSGSGLVTIKPSPGTGAAHNTYVVTGSLTTITATYVNISGGVQPVNALTFTAAANGAVSKLGVWSFNSLGAGTCGWFRLIGSVGDAGALITTAPWLPRLDGSIATSGADLNLSNITFAGAGTPTTIDVFSFTIPAQ